MLKQRIITAILLVALVVGALFFTSTRVFSVLATALLLCAAWEWIHLAGIANKYWRVAYVVGIGGFFYGFAWLWGHILLMSSWLFLVLPLSWLGCWLWIRRYPNIPHFTSYGLSLLGYWQLSSCWLSLVLLHYLSAYWLLFLLLLTWAADTGAYFVGRAYGRRKLMPAVSPNKTVEGFLGGVLLALVVALSGLIWLPVSVNYVWILLLMALLTSYFALIGDLWESLLKRQQGVKDSGTLLPGHGGILDRIDSLLSTAPLFASLFLLFSSSFLEVGLV